MIDENTQGGLPHNVMMSMTGASIRHVAVLGLVDGARPSSRRVFTEGACWLSKERERALPSVFIDSARMLGQDVPDEMIVTNAEIFYRQGRIDEA